MKVQKSYRIEESTVDNMEKLVQHYKQELYEQTGSTINISAAFVIERLVTEKIRQLKLDEK
ncbi:hypothetical protein [Halobacillus sp. A5]|uniref:hypothetical protein n=1 Tax=Halobacillus sp. A5 TaxID=2880263 RepID=UPI0020A6954B|nr:hypothetical protein [Halobacillus sp. A5]MCP3026009.1 hypothetical protein [Halobacillus sp. A5]